MSEKKTLDITATSDETQTTAEPAMESPRRVEFAPNLDVFEGNDSLLIHADLPGVSKDNVHLQLEDGVLTLEGTWTREVGGRPLDDTLTQLRWSRSLKVPKGIDSQAISAHLEDGLLSLTLPFAKAPEPRRIAVN